MPEKLTLLARVFLKAPRSGPGFVEAGAAVPRSVEGGSRCLPLPAADDQRHVDAVNRSVDPHVGSEDGPARCASVPPDSLTLLDLLDKTGTVTKHGWMPGLL